MTDTTLRPIAEISGTAVPVRGHDIDTDRIIPARFLRSTSFDGLGEHLFEDDRGTSPDHGFSNPAFRSASILIVNRNFGCGSSREHAGQGLYQWGIRAALGESFSEIFFGNAVALGMPCLSLSVNDIEQLMRRVEENPALTLNIDLREGIVRAASERMRAFMPASARESFLTGRWDATGLLLANEDAVQTVANRLPYLAGF